MKVAYQSTRNKKADDLSEQLFARGSCLVFSIGVPFDTPRLPIDTIFIASANDFEAFVLIELSNLFGILHFGIQHK